MATMYTLSSLAVVCSIDTLSPTAGGLTTGATAIPRGCNYTIVYGTPTADQQGYILPSAAAGAALGDTLEIHLNPANAIGQWWTLFYPVATESIFTAGNALGQPVAIAVNGRGAVLFRRLNATAWSQFA